MTVNDPLRWIGVVLSIFGNWLLAHKRRDAFLICMVANLLILVASALKEDWPMAGLFAFYIVINLRCWILWR